MLLLDLAHDLYCDQSCQNQDFASDRKEITK